MKPRESHPKNRVQEIYEPLWEDLYAQMKQHSIPLRAIWVADVSNQGASGVLNEDIQGDHSMLPAPMSRTTPSQN